MATYLFSGGPVITMGPRGVLSPGAVLVQDDKIVAVGTSGEVNRFLQEKVIAVNTEISLRGSILIPGLIDAHTHLCQQFVRGLYWRAQQLNKMKQPGWARILMPFEHALTEAQIRMSVLASCVNAVRCGTTFVAEHGGHYPAAMASAMQQVGIRGLLALSTADMNETGLPLPDGMIVSTEEALRMNREVMENYSGLVTGVASLRQITVCSPELITAMYKMAEKHGRPVQTHANEGWYELEFSLRVCGVRPALYLEKLGGLSSRTISAHTVLVDEAEVEALARHGVGVVCCPRGNFRGLGQGQLPLMRRLGVSLGLGSDGGAGGSPDLFEQMRILGVCLDTNSGAPYGRRNVFSPLEILTMATIGGARVVGQQEKIGSIEVGKQADLVVLQPGISAVPIVDLVDTVVSCCSGRDVRWVFVAGRPVMQNGAITTATEEEIIGWVQREVPEIQRRFLEGLD